MSRTLRWLAAAALLALGMNAFAADAGTLLVLNKSDDTVSLLDVASGKAVATIPTGAGRAFVANTNADIVSVIDLGTWQLVDRLKAGKEPDGLGYSPVSVN